MRTLVSYIKAFPRVRRSIDLLGMKIERYGRWLQHTLGYRAGSFQLEFMDYCGSDLGKFDLSEQIVCGEGIVYQLPRGNREEVPNFVKKIFDIEGVTNVRVQQYQVSLNKAKLFDWDDIRPQAELILREEFTR